jgi:hypothetical protein
MTEVLITNAEDLPPHGFGPAHEGADLSLSSDNTYSKSSDRFPFCTSSREKVKQIDKIRRIGIPASTAECPRRIPAAAGGP